MAFSEYLEAPSLISYYVSLLIVAVLEDSLLPYHNTNLHKKHDQEGNLTLSAKLRS